MIQFFISKFFTFKEELLSYSKTERSFILFAMLCGFFITCEYSLIRPVCNSLFIESFSARHFPYAWLAIVPLNFVCVSLYNKWVPKWGSQKLFAWLIGIVALSNLSFALLCRNFPHLSFAFYMWKEIYVMLMFQFLWSMIHSNVQLKRAKYLYGIFFGIGGLGSLFGSSFPSLFAVSYGSENLLFGALPIYALLFVSYKTMCRFSTGDVPDEKKKAGFLHGMKLIRGSRFLMFALLIVMFMQMSVAIVDFQFNDFLERAYPNQDLRTQFSARILGSLHFLTTALQFVGSFILIQSLGFKRSHYSIPFTILLCGSFLVFFPIFPVIAIGFIAIKALDFSLFGALKEMLYVPLKPEEKFQAKAVIDVFAWRTSKAVASLLILGVTHYVSSEHLTWVTLSLAIVWIVAISQGLREYEKVYQTGDLT